MGSFELTTVLWVFVIQLIPISLAIGDWKSIAYFKSTREHNPYSNFLILNGNQTLSSNGFSLCFRAKFRYTSQIGVFSTQVCTKIHNCLTNSTAVLKCHTELCLYLFLNVTFQQTRACLLQRHSDISQYP